MSVDYASPRSAMVDRQLRTTGVNDPAVLAAMGRVPRERFVPAGRQPIAYADGLVPLAPGRAMIEPMTLGLLLTHLGVRPGEAVLVVGAGTGYSAAVLADMGAKVTAVETDAGLAAAAREAGVDVDSGPLAAGWPAGAPYDVLLVDGAVAALPPALLAQLRDGGRVGAIVVGDDGVGRAMVGSVVGGHFGGVARFEAAAPILPGFERPRAFVF